MERLPEWVRPGEALDVIRAKGFSALEKYVEREGHSRVPRSHMEDGFNLGHWVTTQRSTGQRRISPERISWLESLPGWVWNVPDSAWEEGFSVLEKYVQREGHARVPQSHVEDGVNLGIWVSNCKRRRERLTVDQMSRLGDLPGWKWPSKQVKP